MPCGVIDERVILARIRQIEADIEDLEGQPDIFTEGAPLSYKEAQLCKLETQLLNLCEQLAAIRASESTTELEVSAPLC